MRSVPGWVFPGDGFVYSADQDASVVIAGATTTAPAFAAWLRWRQYWRRSHWLLGLHCRRTGAWLRSSRRYWSQFGVHVELVDQAEDGSYGVVNFWNKEFESAGDTYYNGFWDMGEQFVYLHQMSTAEVMIQNQGGLLDDAMVVVEVPAHVDYVPGSASEGWVGVSGDDASSLSQAKDYVKANGYDGLAGMPEPDNVRYFANVYPIILADELVSMEYDFVGSKIGSSTPSYLVDHVRGGTFGMQEALPGIEVKPVTFFFPMSVR